jgi:hypothetical protein
MIDQTISGDERRLVFLQSCLQALVVRAEVLHRQREKSPGRVDEGAFFQRRARHTEHDFAR